MTDFSLEALFAVNAEAYDALPDSYKADSCLKFFYDVNNNLCAELDLGGEFMWLPATKEWVEVN